MKINKWNEIKNNFKRIGYKKILNIFVFDNESNQLIRFGYV